MLVFEFKTYGKAAQFKAVDEAIRTTQFIRNKAIRLWMDGQAKSWVELSKHCALLAKEWTFADKLNSMARQAAAERAWAAISRFYDNCRKKCSQQLQPGGSLQALRHEPSGNQKALERSGLRAPGKKSFPKFQKDCRSVEYKTSGWKLSDDRKSINFTDKHGIGRLKLKGTRDLNFYQINQIKRVRLVKRADGVYVQFCVSADRNEQVEPSGSAVGLDVGLNHYYTDSNGLTVENPRFLRRGEKTLRLSQKRVSRKILGSNNRRKARRILGKRHLKISRQRKDFAVKLARCVITSKDVVAYEDLRVKNMVKNHCLAGSINDASWYQFRVWLEYFGKVFRKITIAVPPNYTSQECSSCGVIVKKSLSTRTHICQCGCTLDRDENAARNILSRGLSTVGHTGTFMLDMSNALGESTSTLAEEILPEQVDSQIKESSSL